MKLIYQFQERKSYWRKCIIVHSVPSLNNSSCLSLLLWRTVKTVSQDAFASQSTDPCSDSYHEGRSRLQIAMSRWFERVLSTQNNLQNPGLDLRLPWDSRSKLYMIDKLAISVNWLDSIVCRFSWEGIIKTSNYQFNLLHLSNAASFKSYLYLVTYVIVRSAFEWYYSKQTLR